MKKKFILPLILILAISLLLSSCGSKETSNPEENLDIQDNGDLVDEVSEEEMEENIEKDMTLRVLDLTNEIIAEHFENVELEDFRIQSETDDADKLYTADLDLFLNVQDKEEAENIIDSYSEIFMEEFNKSETYEEVILIWKTPNHEEAIEKIYY